MAKVKAGVGIFIVLTMETIIEASETETTLEIFSEDQAESEL